MNYILVAVVAIVVLVGAAFVLIPQKDPTYKTDESSKDEKTREEPESQGPTLDLSNQGLTKTPEYVFSRTDLEVLNLSNNKLEGALQAEVRHLKNLRVLDLSDNNFTGVPAEIGQLSNLEVLDLSNNPITGLPNELANLKNLKILDLRGTEYSKQDLDVIQAGLRADVEIKR